MQKKWWNLPVNDLEDILHHSESSVAYLFVEKSFWVAQRLSAAIKPLISPGTLAP